VCGERGKVYVNGVAIAEPYLTEKTAPFPCQKVPQDRYFVMGDNRDNSLDSRFGLGTIPRDAIIGKAFFIVWPPARWNTL
jgi:signal peptidase I